MKTNEEFNFTFLLCLSAAIMPGIFILGASYGECDRVVVVVMFAVGMGFMGTFYSGLKVNNLDLAPNYAGVIMAFTNGIGGLSGIFSPYIVGVLTPNVSVKTIVEIEGTLIYLNVYFYVNSP